MHHFTATSRSDSVRRSSPPSTHCSARSDEVYPIDAEDANAAKQIVLGANQLSARDAIDVVVMRRHDVERILSFDAGFDGDPGVTRID